MTLAEFQKLIYRQTGHLNILGIIFYTLILIIVVQILNRIFSKFVNQFIRRRQVDSQFNTSRIITLTKVLTSVLRGTLYFIAFIIFLSFLNVNTSGILATAGIGSLAIAMGSQTLVKDFIGGLLILIENQMNVGDTVKINDYEGDVESINLRTTRIKDFDGTNYIIPNSEIRVLENLSLNLMRARVDLVIDEEENPTHVYQIIEEALIEYANPHFPERGPRIMGITEVLAKGYNIAIVAFTEAGGQYALKYNMTIDIIEALQREGIKFANQDVSREVIK